MPQSRPPRCVLPRAGRGRCGCACGSPRQALGIASAWMRCVPAATRWPSAAAARNREWRCAAPLLAMRPAAGCGRGPSCHLLPQAWTGAAPALAAHPTTASTLRPALTCSPGAPTAFGSRARAARHHAAPGSRPAVPAERPAGPRCRTLLARVLRAVPPRGAPAPLGPPARRSARGLPGPQVRRTWPRPRDARLTGTAVRQRGTEVWRLEPAQERGASPRPRPHQSPPRSPGARSSPTRKRPRGGRA